MSEKLPSDVTKGTKNSAGSNRENEFVNGEDLARRVPVRLGVAMDTYLAEQSQQRAVEIEEHVEDDSDEGMFSPSFRRSVSLISAGLMFGSVLWMWVTSGFREFDTLSTAMGMVLTWWGVTTWTKHDSTRPSFRKVLPKAGSIVLRGLFISVGLSGFTSLWSAGRYICSLPALYLAWRQIELSISVPPLHRLKRISAEPASPKQLPGGSKSSDLKT